MKPIWKWIIGILAFLILAILGIGWYYSRNWKPIVETKLKETVSKATDGLYSLKYDDLDLNVALGNVTLKNAELIPDSAVYRQMVLSKEAPNSRYHIKLAALKVRRFNIWDVIKNRKLYIKEINFDSPDIHMISERHAYNDTIQPKQSKTLYDNIKDVFSSINVRDINIDNVKFKFSKIEEGKSSDILLDSIGIKVHDILVDQASIHDTTRLFYTKMVEVEVPKFEYELSNGIYKAKFDHLIMNTRDQNVLLTKVEYAPKMSKAAYFKARNENITMAVMKFDTLRFEKLDFKELIDNQQTISQHVQIKNGSVSLYNDKRYPKKSSSKIGKSPQQQLMKVKQLIRIDTVFVDNVDVLYGEHSAKYNKEGIITFNHAKGTLTNVTNDSTLLAKDKFMRADLQARIMNAGLLKIQFGFDMLSKEGFHTYKGSLGRMQAPAFNKILTPLLNAEIASGNIRSISFNFQANDYRNWGDFRFDYDHLKLNLMNAIDPGMSKTKKGVLSFVVNNILINDSNPDANEKYHIGKVNYKRVPEHTFFKTLWQSLLDGIKQCAGISKEREAKLLGAAEKGKDVVDETKGVIKRTGNFFKGIFKKKDKEKEEEKN
ncbi:hypothetical protein SMI01S_00240 [Sphingobacterium mizutaii NBRC 14946 = DSM 11724]|uniref:Uncharacterized protein n=2 Tax=Sphingobacterium mizutaii TaxID=1010 RepID=A0AAJ4XG82_9SPHI|nr:hypothetical protein [Sphingobacterium mizutaii]GEM66418.1 hypothetical protein SMI01S_00240 [Sphingobacterium mizutaii NBRC 14946 = DSM 11724]SDL54972.1 hypothetical protein SAMN05192578_104348 [Sphingobacterium mizutaii]SNV63892.1 Uncharacterised protein [Sphingobacterium mizutaii]